MDINTDIHKYSQMAGNSDKNVYLHQISAKQSKKSPLWSYSSPTHWFVKFPHKEPPQPQIWNGYLEFSDGAAIFSDWSG